MASSQEQLLEQEVPSQRLGEIRSGVSELRHVYAGMAPAKDTYSEIASDVMGSGAISSETHAPSVAGSQAGVNLLARPSSDYRVEQ